MFPTCRTVCVGRDFRVDIPRAPTSDISMGIPPGGLGEVGATPGNPFYAAPLRYAALAWEGEGVMEEGEGSLSSGPADRATPSTTAETQEPQAVEEFEERPAPSATAETREPPAVDEVVGRISPSATAETREPPAVEEVAHRVAKAVPKP